MQFLNQVTYNAEKDLTGETYNSSYNTLMLLRG